MLIIKWIEYACIKRYLKNVADSFLPELTGQAGNLPSGTCSRTTCNLLTRKKAPQNDLAQTLKKPWIISEAAQSSSHTTAGSSTVSPHTFLPLRVIALSGGSKAIIQIMKQTGKRDWEKRPISHIGLNTGS